MYSEKRQVGNIAEQRVVEHLERAGFTIRDRNVLCRRGELDIVAERGPLLCFVEVRSRATGVWGDPSASVSWSKQRKIVWSAMEYCQKRHLFQRVIRFDVASVIGSDVTMIEEAFDAGM